MSQPQPITTTSPLPRRRSQRASLARMLAAMGADALPASAATSIASLLGAYSDAESAARAERCARILLPAALELGAPAAAPHSEAVRQRTSRSARHSAAERAQRLLQRRGHRRDPAKGVRSWRTREGSYLASRAVFPRRRP